MCHKVVIFMFMGEYNHTIDPKGRVIMPVKFREKLGENFTITKGIDRCLQVFDAQEWSAIEEKVAKLPMTDKKAREFARFLFAGAVEVETDKQGRILIPTVLREYAGLDKDVVLLGAASRVEIWSKEKWDAAEENIDIDDIASHMQELGMGI